MRLFLAVDVDEGVRTALGAAIASLRTSLREWEPAVERAIKWVDPGHLHLTLRFLGEISDAGVSVLTRALAAPVAHPPFVLGLGDLGVFPPSGPARVIWIGCEQGASDLIALQRMVSARIEGISTRADDRPFSAHLTLGRFRAPERAAVRSRLAAFPRPAAGTCTVSSVTLYQSRLTPAGPNYSVIMRSPLEP